MKHTFHVLILFVLFLATACGGAEDAQFTEVKEAIKSNQGKSFVLAEHTTFEWDRVHFFGPYVSYSTIHETAGYDPPADLEQEYVESKNPHVPEGSCVIVFTNGGDLVAGYLHPRGDFDSWKLSARSFSPQQAVFYVAPGEYPCGPVLELPDESDA